MKKYGIMFNLLFLASIMSACAGAATPNATDVLVSGIYTSAAMTLTSGADKMNLISSNQGSNLQAPAEVNFPTPTLIFPTADSQVIPMSTSTLAYVYSAGCENSKYLNDVTIPDDTVIAAGETFVKTWMFENTGTCDWSPNYSLTFYEGDSMDGVSTTIDQAVRPGGKAEISVLLVAPTAKSTYTGYWILADKQGVAFGSPVYVRIIVSEDEPTCTPTNGPEATSTPTSMGTAVIEPSATPTDTQTPTFTPSPTFTGDSTDGAADSAGG
jgi:hypothetical protein